MPIAAPRRRLDAELVRRGLAPSRERAKEVIEAGEVTVGGAPTTKPSRQVGAGEAIEVLGPPPRFVSRAGGKLEAALEKFQVDVRGRRAIDVGASTGGFTDCLLQCGAREVVAIDVGYGQLHERLRADERVTSLERTDVREVDPDEIGGPAAMVTADVSFISLRVVLPALARLVTSEGDLVVLVKPQFEAGREAASRGRGIITDPAIWHDALHDVMAAAVDVGLHPHGVIASPVTGTHGNVEFLLHLRRY